MHLAVFVFFLLWCVHVGGWRREGGVNLSVREEGYDSINT